MRPLIVLALWLTAGAASAHAVGGPAEAPPGWSLDLWIVLPLLIGLVLFATGWTRLARRSGLGWPGLRRRGALFAAGWLVLAGALVSPLHEAGERSFTAHMLEHELLMLVAAPLLVLSEPLAVMLWAFPRSGRRRIGRVSASRPVQIAWRGLTDPVTATLLQAAALWFWHAPALFDLALASPLWHAVQHLSFLVSALLFWSAMLHPRQSRSGKAAAVLCLFATAVVSGALGALMAFSESPWYAAYAALGQAPFGLTPAEDQQVAGLLMWIPGGLVHVAAALALLGSALKEAADGV
jgi:cytochrome c oxidase assembly factor CtaG